jgi:hypothetical protein
MAKIRHSPQRAQAAVGFEGFGSAGRGPTSPVNSPILLVTSSKVV